MFGRFSWELFKLALAGSDPELLTRIWKHWNGSSDEVHVLDNLSFYMFYYNDVKKQCFGETAGDRFDFNMKILKEKAYVVHLNSKITGNEGMSTRKLQEGTICSHLLNSYCVLWSQFSFIILMQELSSIAILYCSLNLMCLQKLVTNLKYRGII